MARTSLASFTVAPLAVGKNEFSSKGTWKALVQLGADDTPIYKATYGAYGLFIPLEDRDDKFTILLRNKSTSTKTIYIHKGDNPFYGASEDLTLELAAGTAGTAATSTITADPVYTYYAVDIDSAKYAFYNAEGVYKNGICILGPDANVEVLVIKKK